MNTHIKTIVDEGIIHQIGRIVYKNPELIDVSGEIKELMDLAPLPDALIYVYTDAKIISCRLESRSHITTIHKNLDVKDLEIVTTQSLERRKHINLILKNKGIPICYVDATKPLNYNIKQIMEFCESI